MALLLPYGLLIDSVLVEFAHGSVRTNVILRERCSQE